MSDNPFSEPDDDRTVIRPVPGFRRPTPASATPPPRPASPPPRQPQAAFDAPASPAVSVSPLAAAASPLLQLLGSLRALRRPPDPQALRNRVQHDLGNFERQAREADIPMELLRPAHYALCASIDDVVLNTPWGAASAWADRTLVATFHQNARGTDDFFDLLRQARQPPQKLLSVIELMFLCLSLGFMGRYRQSRTGNELEQLRADVHATIEAHRNPAEPELSRRWRGIEARQRPNAHELPVWVAVAGAAAVCGGLLFWTSSSLSAASDRLETQVLAAPPAGMPQITRAAIVEPVQPPPAPPEPTVLDRLRVSLQGDIDRQTISLLGTPAMPIVRITDRSMFSPGSATLRSASLPLLERVAAALRREPGALRVIDYTDNQPVRTVQFPSSVQLSLARARAVGDVIASDIGDASRISSEGRGGIDPIAPNTTAEGRAQNRRTEIVLQRQD